jgi:hypothetical protein
MTFTKSANSNETHKPWPVRSAWGIGLFFLPFFLAGAVAVGFGARNVWLAYASERWPNVQGVITVSEISHDDETTGAKISYSYAVDGKPFEGSGVSFGDYSSSDSGHAHAILTKYPKGKQVQVCYQPSNPARSVLEPGFCTGLLLAPLFGMLFLIVPGLVAVLITKVRRLAVSQTAKLAADRKSFAGKWRQTVATEYFQSYWCDAPQYHNWRIAQDSHVVLEVQQDKLLAVPRSLWKAAFGLLIASPLFAAIPYFIGAPVWFTSVFAGFPLLVLIMLLTQRILMNANGAPLIVDRDAQVVFLPPLKKEFLFSDVAAFQWARGIQGHSSATRSELNLLVREDGQVIRYPVLREPSQQHICEILAFTGLPLDEIDFGLGVSQNVESDV